MGQHKSGQLNLISVRTGWVEWLRSNIDSCMISYRMNNTGALEKQTYLLLRKIDWLSVDTIGPGIEQRNKTVVSEEKLKVTHLGRSLCSLWYKTISFYFIFSDTVTWPLLVGAFRQRQVWAVCAYVATTLITNQCNPSCWKESLWKWSVLYFEFLR